MAHNERLIYDIGLHRGEDTDFYLKKGYEVVAFEAHPAHVEFCRNRFAQEIRSGQLHIIEGAIARPTSTGRVRFYINNNVSVWGTIDTRWVAINGETGAGIIEIEVNIVNLSDIMENMECHFT